MIVNCFFASEPIEVENKAYPECWTIEDPAFDEEGEPAGVIVRLMDTFEGYPKRPDTVGTYNGKQVYYLALDSDREAAQLQAIKDAGAYLCGSYESMNLVDPELYKAVMECYQGEGEERTRVKLKDFTGDISTVTIHAPVKVAGVDVQDKVAPPDEAFPTTFDRMSGAELYFRAIKETVKAKAIGYIKAHSDCTQESLLASFADPQEQATLVLMLPYYIGGAYQGGLIAEMSFEAFRDFVVATQVEALAAI